MKKHTDYITHIDNKEDYIYLKNVHFPVNMRLFNSSEEYKKIILIQCNYIRKCCLDVKEGYKKPHGMSSANVGLAFNIIGVTKKRNTKNEYCQIMINPRILELTGDYVDAISNCGSLTLKKPITIKRYTKCLIKYYNEKGELREEQFNRINNSFTIQHEIDHNLGVLITDL